MNFFDHKDLGNHLLQLCPKVVKHPVYIYETSKLSEIFFLTSFLVLKMSPSTFFGRFCLFLLKYLSFMFAGNFTPEISNFVLVAITKFWLMRRRGHALILKGPEVVEKSTANILLQMCTGGGSSSNSTIFYEHYST